MSDFKDRSAATPEAQAERRAAELDAARRRARDLHPLPPAERPRGPGRRPRTDGEREDWAQVYEQERRTPTPPPQTRTERFRQRLQRRLRLADARIERVLGSRQRLGNAIDTAMDAILFARRTGTPATKMDRYRERHKRARHRLDRYERAVEPVVRDHDAAVRREALTRERQHEREHESG